MEKAKDLTNRGQFYSWALTGLSAAIATITTTFYFDAKKQRDDAVERVNMMTDRIWEKEYTIQELEQEARSKDNLIRYADSTLRDNTEADAKKILDKKR
ncbi:hypothetical protein [Sphingobacterium paludis]|uniref:Uncharacterized protein n=1 Tax=Sphingobacterium paludis TaxID=1476465 RepID=A0A4R7D6Y3_9SPHI|nr:hypothetical protein [Sphingobacterium paludis]TDS14736.1 hypothetical protein B0I21_103235 [Sphingobacterium paludis]